MTDRFVDLEERVERLEGALRGLERRLSTLGLESRTDREDLPAVDTARAAGDLSGVLALLGRACLVLGGAFLIRAATEAGEVSRAAGAGAGLLYAGIWLFFSDRDGRRGRNSSAAFHGVAAAGIAFPLLWELCTRFAILSARGAAAAVAAAAILLLALSLRQKTAALAWAATLGSVSTLFALVVSTGAIGSAAAAAIVLAGATIGLARRPEWRWSPLAFPRSAGFGGALAAAASAGKNLSPDSSVALALALPVVCEPALVLPAILRRRAMTLCRKPFRRRLRCCWDSQRPPSPRVRPAGRKSRSSDCRRSALASPPIPWRSHPRRARIPRRIPDTSPAWRG